MSFGTGFLYGVGTTLLGLSAVGWYLYRHRYDVARVIIQRQTGNLFDLDTEG